MAESMKLLLYIFILLTFWLVWKLVQVVARLNSPKKQEEPPDNSFFHSQADKGEKDITDKAKIIEDNPSSDR